MSQPLMQVIESLIHEPAADYHAKAGEFLSSHLLASFVKVHFCISERWPAKSMKSIGRRTWLARRPTH